MVAVAGETSRALNTKGSRRQRKRGFDFIDMGRLRMEIRAGKVDAAGWARRIELLPRRYLKQRLEANMQ
jgi:hypothetical protein